MEQDYALVTQTLGCSSLKVVTQDGTPYLGMICGRLRGKQWISVGDVVLISSRDFDGAGGYGGIPTDTGCTDFGPAGSKVDVIAKYTRDNAKMLMKKGHFKMPKDVFGQTDSIGMGGGSSAKGIFFEDSDDDEDGDGKSCAGSSAHGGLTSCDEGGALGGAFDDLDDDEDDDALFVNPNHRNRLVRYEEGSDSEDDEHHRERVDVDDL